MAVCKFNVGEEVVCISAAEGHPMLYVGSVYTVECFCPDDPMTIYVSDHNGVEGAWYHSRFRSYDPISAMERRVIERRASHV